MQDQNIDKFSDVAKTMSLLCESYCYYLLIANYLQQHYPEIRAEAGTYAQENIHPDHTGNIITDTLQEEAV